MFSVFVVMIQQSNIAVAALDLHSLYLPLLAARWVLDGLGVQTGSAAGSRAATGPNRNRGRLKSTAGARTAQVAARGGSDANQRRLRRVARRAAEAQDAQLVPIGIEPELQLVRHTHSMHSMLPPVLDVWPRDSRPLAAALVKVSAPDANVPEAFDVTRLDGCMLKHYLDKQQSSTVFGRSTSWLATAQAALQCQEDKTDLQKLDDPNFRKKLLAQARQKSQIFSHTWWMSGRMQWAGFLSHVAGLAHQGIIRGVALMRLGASDAADVKARTRTMLQRRRADSQDAEPKAQAKATKGDKSLQLSRIQQSHLEIAFAVAPPGPGSRVAFVHGHVPTVLEDMDRCTGESLWQSMRGLYDFDGMLEDIETVFDTDYIGHTQDSCAANERAHWAGVKEDDAQEFRRQCRSRERGRWKCRVHRIQTAHTLVYRS